MRIKNSGKERKGEKTNIIRSYYKKYDRIRTQIDSTRIKGVQYDKQD